MTMFLATVDHMLLERVAGFIHSGQVTPFVGQRFQLEDVPEAMRQLAAGRASGKTAITGRPADQNS